ncbi:hypothetical protein ACTFBW_19075 [Aeromonas rivipollensis]
MDINNKLRLIASYIGPRLLTYSLGIDSGQLEELDKIATSLSDKQNEAVSFIAKKSKKSELSKPLKA